MIVLLLITPSFTIRSIHCYCIRFIVKPNKVVIKLQKKKGDFSFDHWQHLTAKKKRSEDDKKLKNDPSAGKHFTAALRERSHLLFSLTYSTFLFDPFPHRTNGHDEGYVRGGR